MKLYKWVVGIGFAIVIFIVYRITKMRKDGDSYTPPKGPSGGGNGPRPD